MALLASIPESCCEQQLGNLIFFHVACRTITCE
jgi:hypothetical protein